MNPCRDRRRLRLLVFAVAGLLAAGCGRTPPSAPPTVETAAGLPIAHSPVA
jgi:hypothetical protein